MLPPLLAAALCGLLMPVQSSTNGALAEQVGPAPAALISFGGGLLILSLVLLAPRRRRHALRIPAALRAGRLRPWQILGGVAGGLLVATQTLAVPRVGVAAFIIALIGGQTVSALIVDRAGIGPTPAQRISAFRVGAALVAVAGVALAATAPGRQGLDGTSSSSLVLGALAVVLVFLAGAGSAVQQACNGLVTTVTRDPWPTAWLNFLTGTFTLLLVAGLPWWFMRADNTPGATAPGGDPQWWMFAGGPVGVVFIVLAAWAVQHLPVLVFGLVSVSTQLLGGLLMDLLDPRAVAMSPQVLAGMLLALTASVAAAVGRARSARRAPLQRREVGRYRPRTSEGPEETRH